MTNSSPPPDPSQSSRRKRPVVTFDEMVAIIVAFSTIGAILFWSWGGSKNKLFEQDWQGFKLSVEDTEDLKTDPNRIFALRNSLDTVERDVFVDRELEEIPVVVLPEDSARRELRDRSVILEEETTIGTYNPPLVVIPTEPITGTLELPEVVETPTEPEVVPIPTEPEVVETPTEPLVTFDDVPSDYWAYPFIEPLIEKELIVGISDNEFEPDLSITRAQLGAEIEKAFKQDKSRDLINFEDINQDSKIAEKIDEAVKTGFMRGYPGQIFRPEQPVPRLQVLVALVSGLDLKSEQDPDTILSSYQDADQIPNWAKEKMAIAVESGLVVNRPDFSQDLLYPDEHATRAEVVAMIYQALVKAGRIEPITSPYVISTP